MPDRTKTELLANWNTITSISTVVIYILYFIVFRLRLGAFAAYFTLLLNIVNIGLIIYTLILLIKYKNIIENPNRPAVFGTLRIFINLILLLLIWDYATHFGNFVLPDSK